MKQSQAFDILKLGHNVYLTGSAGSGKTFLLNKYIKYLKNKKVEVGITASTGIAATHIQGVTIHSWSGFGIKESLTDKDLQKMIKKRYLNNRFSQAKVLIIDEVSMLHSFHLDLVNKICQYFKGNSLPFGGLQVILCGDFFQLPPISHEGVEPKFVNQSDSWAKMNLKVCYLDEQYRHQDSELVRMLNEIRANKISDQTLEIIEKISNQETVLRDDITKLYTHNVDVDAINNQRLGLIKNKTCVYDMRSMGVKGLVKTLKKSCLAPEGLALKIGAVVMFVKNNYDQGYVNGTLGRVIGFDEKSFPVVETIFGKEIVAAPVSWVMEEEGKIKAEIVQIPLRLAWAITVHKSQGMTLDAAEIDLSKSFEPGMGYVALSRVKSIKGLKLKGINDMALVVSESIIDLDFELKERSKDVAAYIDNLDLGLKQKKQKIYLQSITPKEAELKKRQKKIPGQTYEETKKLVLKKLSIKEIAIRRGMLVGTILSHLEKLVKRGDKLNLDHLKPPRQRFELIKQAFEKSGKLNLSPVRQILGRDFSYDELRLARLFIDLN